VAEFLQTFLPESFAWLAYTAAAAVHVVLLFTLAMMVVAISNWAERKIAGRLQDRLGPSRVGGRFGWLQSVADGIKLLTKEDLIPAGADRFLFRLAPYLSFCASFSVYLALPMAMPLGSEAGSGWVAQRLNVAVFFVLALAGLEVLGVILAGYASGSKWSLFGGMREAAQVVSYEVPLALCAAVPVMVAGSMDLIEIGNRQAGGFWQWLVFHDPFICLTFFVYLTCAVASVNRAPFDLAEAESELVAGFMTEYSGFRWSVFFMAEYASMFAVSVLAAILFFGGWNGPLPVARLLGLTYENHPLAGYLGGLLGLCNLLVKGYLGIMFMMWLRWTHPRLRIDQVMTVCLKYCIPLAAAMLLGAMLWCYVLPGGLWAAIGGSGVSPVPAAGGTGVSPVLHAEHGQDARATRHVPVAAAVENPGG
jgi:NADH-quinone oxidoreductase subunit H